MEMRMWNINPRYMCRKHLLGEHVETHMLVGSLRKEKSVQGINEVEEWFDSLDEDEKVEVVEYA